jgi:hypothetical protein
MRHIVALLFVAAPTAAQVNTRVLGTEAEPQDIQNECPIGLSFDSDILVAPRHGADNGSCAAFIQAVSPDWVIVSAGRRYEHPNADAMARYLAEGIPTQHFLRTDRGDDEGERNGTTCESLDARTSPVTTT